MEFEILYCKPCGYRERAEDLGAELEQRFGATVSIEEGKFGQFDVLLNGEVVATKSQSFFGRVLKHGAPPQRELLATIEKYLADRDGDVCELPAAGRSVAKSD